MSLLRANTQMARGLRALVQSEATASDAELIELGNALSDALEAVAEKMAARERAQARKSRRSTEPDLDRWRHLWTGQSFAPPSDDGGGHAA